LEKALEQLIERFESEGDRLSTTIPRESVLSWIASTNLETLGALHALLARDTIRKAISPPLDYRDYFRFMILYLFRCLSENPSGEWASTRYEAGWELCRWFMQLWKDDKTDRKLLAELKESLAAAYRAGNPDVQLALETAVLEHLFENSKVVNFFADWQQDPVLNRAFRAAKQWTDQGGKGSIRN
jgi:hypothetical protein